MYKTIQNQELELERERALSREVPTEDLHDLIFETFLEYQKDYEKIIDNNFYRVQATTRRARRSLSQIRKLLVHQREYLKNNKQEQRFE